METLFTLLLGPGLVEDLLSTRCLLCALVCFLSLAGLDVLPGFGLFCSAFNLGALYLALFCA